jgi:hypothetical protein
MHTVDELAGLRGFLTSLEAPHTVYTRQGVDVKPREIEILKLEIAYLDRILKSSKSQTTWGTNVTRDEQLHSEMEALTREMVAGGKALKAKDLSPAEREPIYEQMKQSADERARLHKRLGSSIWDQVPFLASSGRTVLHLL